MIPYIDLNSFKEKSSRLIVESFFSYKKEYVETFDKWVRIQEVLIRYSNKRAASAGWFANSPLRLNLDKRYAELEEWEKELNQEKTKIADYMSGMVFIVKKILYEESEGEFNFSIDRLMCE